MPDQMTLAALQELGLTQSEAKIYLSLLAGSAANGNQVARLAGVPSAKVYENLERLTLQGLVAQLEDGRYVPLDLEEFLAQKSSRMREVADLLRASVRRKAHDVHGEILWHGTGYQALLDRAQRLVATANEEALVSAWPAEIVQLRPSIEAALRRGARVAVLTFASHADAADLFGALIDHPALNVHGHAMLPTVHARHGSHAAFVADEVATLLMNGNALMEWVGVRTTNAAVVQTVANFIRHDIYINKLYEEFRPSLEAAYGADLSLLLDPHRGGVKPGAAPLGGADSADATASRQDAPPQEEARKEVKS